MNHVGNWIMGAITAVLAVGSLLVAADADGQGVGYYGGLLFFLFAVGFVFLLIKDSYDRDAH